MITVYGIYNGERIILSEPLKVRSKYKVLVTFIEEIETDLKDDIVCFGEHSDGFEFWNDKREDLYQDYLNA